MVSIYLSVVSARDHKPQFTASLCGLVWYLGLHKDELKIEHLELKIGSQCSLTRSREEALSYAEENGFTHFFCADDDMVFPADTIARMLACNKDVVTVNTCRKSIGQTLGVCMDLFEQPIDSKNKRHLEMIGWMGMGCALMKCEKTRKIAKPRFEIRWVNHKQNYLGEDYYFSSKARQAGLQLFCDHALTQEIGHVGDYQHNWPQNTELNKALESVPAMDLSPLMGNKKQDAV